MGATGIYTKKSFDEVISDELTQMGYKIVAKHYVKETPLNGELEEGHYYTALRHPNGYVFACVITVVRVNHNGREEVIYKLIDESMGPSFYECPEHVLSALSKLSEIPYVGYAAEWRSKNKSFRDKQMHLFTS